MDQEEAAFPGNPEVCDGIDNDCNDAVDDNPADAVQVYADADGDGYGSVNAIETCTHRASQSLSGGDCNDGNAAIHPDAPESDCSDPTDYNCDGTVAYADADADGSPACEDCNDANPDQHPAAQETCNNLDDDCDQLIDDADPSLSGASTFYRDLDGDGYAGSGASTTACTAPVGYAANTGDCDDGDAAIHPAATEVCDPLDTDEDCDGSSDDSTPAPTPPPGAIGTATATATATAIPGVPPPPATPSPPSTFP